MTYFCDFMLFSTVLFRDAMQKWVNVTSTPFFSRHVVADYKNATFAIVTPRMPQGGALNMARGQSFL